MQWMQWALITYSLLCYWPTPAEEGWLTCITLWHSDRLTKSPSRAETQASDASQMAVRSWPPSSAITTRPPARAMSISVSCPKPANTQSRNASQHSTITSEKSSSYHGRKQVWDAHTWQTRCILQAETGDPQLHRSPQTPEPHLDWSDGQWASPHTCSNTHWSETVLFPKGVPLSVFYTPAHNHLIDHVIILSQSRNANSGCIPKGSEVLHITHWGLHPSSPCYVYIKSIARTWSHLQRYRLANSITLCVCVGGGVYVCLCVCLNTSSGAPLPGKKFPSS